MYEISIQEPFEDISDAYNATDGSILLTTLYILGVPHHLGAVRVTDEVIDDAGLVSGSTEQHAVDECLQKELEKVFNLYDTAFLTVNIPGFDGEYVLYTTPHGI